MQVADWYPVLSNGHGLRYPGDSQYTVASSVRLGLTHPTGIVIAAPGTLVSSTATTKVYSMAQTRDYAFGASPSFRHATGTVGGVQVVVWSLPGTASGAAVAAATAALGKYAASYGPYPRTRF